jgi:8-oxo-dGTP pyrophosphatase MutT (NUDIX family)
MARRPGGGEEAGEASLILTMVKTAEVILVTQDNHIILQQRDDKPDIVNPGKITAFGGRLEEGEEPLDAAVRETEEEVSIKLEREDFELLGVYYKTKEKHGQDAECWAYLARNINADDIDLKEGAGIVIISREDNLKDFNLSILADELVRDFFKSELNKELALKMK